MELVLIGFVLTMIMFVLIGIASVRSANAHVSDYLVAGRSVSPWAAGRCPLVGTPLGTPSGIPPRCHTCSRFLPSSFGEGALETNIFFSPSQPP